MQRGKQKGEKICNKHSEMGLTDFIY